MAERPRRPDRRESTRSAASRVTRRRVVTGLGSLAALGVSGGAYAVGIEPRRLSITEYALSPAAWRGGPRLRIAALADVHACEPWMSAARIEGIVQLANGLRPDITVLLGDYVAGNGIKTGVIEPAVWAAALARLSAPLGVHAILGNHDWWDDPVVQRDGKGTPAARTALERVGIPVYDNEVVRLEKDGRPFWLAGLGDQLAYFPLMGRETVHFGIDDLPATLAQIPDGAPALLLAHEPDIFPDVPARIALTLSGHTHGGQVRLFGYSPIVPSRFNNRYAYGHVREQADLIVSGGLGCSIVPVRFGVPPEIVVIEIAPPP